MKERHREGNENIILYKVYFHCEYEKWSQAIVGWNAGIYLPYKILEPNENGEENDIDRRNVK